MRYVRVVLVVLFSAVMFSPAFAGVAGIETLAYKDYRFLVEIYNQYGQQASGVKSSLTVKDNIARIDVAGTGHLPDFWETELKSEKVHHIRFKLKDPAITKSLSDKTGTPVDGCVYLKDKPVNLYFGFNYGFSVEFPKTGYEKISACSFKVYLNGKEIEAYSPITYLSSKQDKWRLEVVINRKLLDITCNNHFEIMVFHCLHSQPDAILLVSMADDYSRNLELAKSICDETSLLMIQDRLESNAQILNIYFTLMDASEQREVLSKLSAEGDLVRSLKTLTAFAELHH